MKIAKGDENLDRLSELPESLILRILSWLGMRDVVKTSLLSKRWVDLWTTVPSLNFFSEPASPQTLNFIDRVLQHWRGTKIQKFMLIFMGEYDESMSGGMDSWLRFATEKNVEELYIILPYDFTNTEESVPAVYSPPQCLYSCSSITKLHIRGNHNLEIPGNLQWGRLKDLIIKAHSISVDVINRIVSSTPRLEILEFRIIGSDDLCSIRSTSLKTLKIYSQLNTISLKIWAPNLESLEISGVTCPATCLLLNVASLTNLSLGFSENCDVKLGKTLNQILPIIKHVEALSLSFCCIKMLGVIMKGKHSFSVPFTNVKILRIKEGCIEPNDISVLVEIFPNVEKLFIDWRSDPWLTRFLKNLSQKHDIGVNHLDLEAKNLKPFLMQLRIVEVTWHSYEVSSIFKVIKFVLKHATMVQRLVQQIVIKKEHDKGRLLGLALAPRELLRLQRSFPTVDMIFCQK